jgi:hypothetical protein
MTKVSRAVGYSTVSCGVTPMCRKINSPTATAPINTERETRSAPISKIPSAPAVKKRKVVPLATPPLILSQKAHAYTMAIKASGATSEPKRCNRGVSAQATETSAAYFQCANPWRKRRTAKSPTPAAATQAPMLAARNRRATFSG